MKKNAQKRAAFFLPVLFLTLCVSLCACNEPVTDTGFALDTSVNITLTGGTHEDIQAIMDNINAVSDTVQTCFDTPANALTDAGLQDLTRLCADLSAVFDPDRRFVDLYAGTLTRLWGVSTENAHIPGDEDIKSALRLLQDARFIDDENGGIYSNLSALPEGIYLDPGAVAKGFALDRVKMLLESDMKKVKSATVSTGSSVLHYGKKPGGGAFTTGIKSPFETYTYTTSGFISEIGPHSNAAGSAQTESSDNADKEAVEETAYLGYIETPAAFISTSGGYERFFEVTDESGETVRYSHIFDINTGYPIDTDLVSVTVIVPILPDTTDCGIMSDYLSTLILMEGTDRIDYFESFSDLFTFIAVDRDGEIYGNEGIELMYVARAQN
jgi:thiamine biosynthesis lipoprotein